MAPASGLSCSDASSKEHLPWPVAIAPDHKHMSRFLWTAAIVGGIGVSSLIYDRVAVQGIGFSSGLAQARAAWATSGMERLGGVSSVFSAVGNILWALAYVVLALVVLVWERLRVFERVVLLILAGGMIIATSALNGGRTPILLGLGIFISVCLVRSSVGLALFPPLLVKVRKMRVLVALCILAYFPYISILRSEMTQIDARTYATIMLTLVHGQWTDGIHDLDSLPNSVEAGVYPVLLSGIQWVHPFLVLETVIEVPDRSGAELLGP